jgi:thymidylate kinase
LTDEPVPPEHLSIIGDDARILHWLPGDNGSEGGRDVDCAVRRMDPLWPLRLTGGWRLCQSLRHDFGSWYWILEKDGAVLAIDVLDDEAGLGRDGFPTSLAFNTSGAWAPPPVRAAYLTTKRLRKRNASPEEWSRIRALADVDQTTFLESLKTMFPGRVAQRLADSVIRGGPPTQRLGADARRSQVVHRFRSPRRAWSAVVKGTTRVAGRLTHPTGMVVLVVGPDGSGKSSLADSLGDACAGLFRRQTLVHWRPGFLPRLGALVGNQKGDPSDPHGRSLHSGIVSLAVLAYYWMDFLLGGWLKLWPQRARTGLVVLERGWWDMAVDPARYRINIGVGPVQWLGSLLIKPDLVLFLHAPTDVLLSRKIELPAGELERQNRAWPQILPKSVECQMIDASDSLEDVIGKARRAIVESLEARATACLAYGWASLPTAKSGRWCLPRGPRRTARTAQLIYQPMTISGRVGWEAARLLAGLGGFRLLPRGQPPPDEVRELLARHIPARGNVAVARGNGPGRFLGLVIAEDGTPLFYVKLRTDADGARSLAREARAIETLAQHLRSPLGAPKVVARKDGLLMFEFVGWKPRVRPWVIPEDVAGALGSFFRGGTQAAGESTGRAHGDFAPWNLAHTREGWILLDWEEATEQSPPFIDLCHYVVRSHALLGRPSRREILLGLNGGGWIGRAFWAYARGAMIDPNGARTALVSYLQMSETDSRGDNRRGDLLAARSKLLSALIGT